MTPTLLDTDTLTLLHCAQRRAGCRHS